MVSKERIRDELFKLLEDLKANNNREWFKANKQRYDQSIKEPALAFISDFSPHLQQISRAFKADPRPVGGSLFRINRDTRFAKDKSPYKTNTGLHFRHVAGKDAHAPGFYLHLEPGSCFAGVGIWHPDTKTANKIREAIGADDGKAWKKATGSKRFRETYQLMGESLKRPPKGFAPDHPFIEDLKRKDFIGSVTLSQQQITAKDFLEQYAALCRAGRPFVEFLCHAIGVDF